MNSFALTLSLVSIILIGLCQADPELLPQDLRQIPLAQQLICLWNNAWPGYGECTSGPERAYVSPVTAQLALSDGSNSVWSLAATEHGGAPRGLELRIVETAEGPAFDVAQYRIRTARHKRGGVERAIEQLRKQLATGEFATQNARERWNEASNAYKQWQDEEQKRTEEGLTDRGYEIQKRRIQAMENLYQNELKLAQEAGVDTKHFELDGLTREQRMYFNVYTT